MADEKKETEGVRAVVAAAHNLDEGDDGDRATNAETRASLAALSERDWLRLRAGALKYRRYLPARDVEELVGEAALRLLNGRRNYRRGVNFMAVMLQTMRSIASEWVERNLRADIPDSRLKTKPDDERETSFLERQSSPGGDPSETTRLRELIRRFESEFGDDDHVTAIILGRIENLSPEETQKEFEMTPNEYLAAQKRLRRAVLTGRMDD